MRVLAVVILSVFEKNNTIVLHVVLVINNYIIIIITLIFVVVVISYSPKIVFNNSKRGFSFFAGHPVLLLTC